MTSTQRAELHKLFPNQSIIELWSQSLPHIRVNHRDVTTSLRGAASYYLLYGAFFGLLISAVMQQFTLSLICLIVFVVLLMNIIFNRNFFRNLGKDETYIAICLTDSALYILDQVNGTILERFLLENIGEVSVSKPPFLSQFSMYNVDVEVRDEDSNSISVKTYQGIIEPLELPTLVRGMKLYKAKHSS